MPDWRGPACRRSAARRWSRAARSSRCASIRVWMPLSASSRPTNAIVTGPAGSGIGCSVSTSTPEPGISDDAFGGDAEREHAGAIVGVLHQHDLAVAVEQPAEQGAHDGAQQPRLGAARREGVAEPGQRVDARAPAVRAPRASPARRPAARRDGRWPARPRGGCAAARGRWRWSPSGESRPRTNGTGCSTKPSASIAAAPSTTRVATWTSKPASRAARAIGRRCERKYQSSVTT